MTHKFTHQIVPSVCRPKKDKETESVPAWSGHVTLRARSFEERMSLHDEFDAEERAANEKDPAGAEWRKDEKERASRKWRFLARRVPHYVEEVALTRLADGQLLTSWAEVEHESELDTVVVEVALALVGRSSVGNPSEPSC